MPTQRKGKVICAFSYTNPVLRSMIHRPQFLYKIQVAVKQRPARSKLRKKSALKWKNDIEPTDKKSDTAETPSKQNVINAF